MRENIIPSPPEGASAEKISASLAVSVESIFINDLFSAYLLLHGVEVYMQEKGLLGSEFYDKMYSLRNRLASSLPQGDLENYGLTRPSDPGEIEDPEILIRDMNRLLQEMIRFLQNCVSLTQDAEGLGVSIGVWFFSDL